MCDFWVLSYFLPRFQVFVDICAFSCLSLFLSDEPKKLWCRQCFGDFGTDLVFSFRKRPTWLHFASRKCVSENRGTPVVNRGTPVVNRGESWPRFSDHAFAKNLLS